jgi:hypothetical protein
MIATDQPLVRGTPGSVTAVPRSLTWAFAETGAAVIARRRIVGPMREGVSER